MVFGIVNIWAVLVATIASMAVGAIWYSTLATPWMKAAGLTIDDIQPKNEDGTHKKQSPLPYIIAAASNFVMAFLFAGLLHHLNALEPLMAIVTAFFVWLAFIIPTMTVNHRFQMSPWSLTIIDCGHWLTVLVIQGLIIALFGA